jgi:hypothetical protein
MLLLAEDESTSIVKRRPCWSVIKPVRITFGRIVCSSPERLNLGFLTEGKLAAIFIKTLLLGSPINSNQAFSGAVAGEEVEDLCKGSFSHTSFTLF